MEASKIKGQPLKRQRKHELKQYQYNGSKSFIFTYKNNVITLDKGDIITMKPNKLTLKLRRMLTEIEADD